MRVLITTLLIFTSIFSYASSNSKNKDIDINKIIFEHLTDNYHWHIVSDISIPLPVILYNKKTGLSVFMSSRFGHNGENVVNGYKLEENKIIREDNQYFLDLSITKNVLELFIASFILLILFISAAKSYKKSGISAPKGLQSLVEPLILFVKNEIALPMIGEKKYHNFLPYLLTVFFFIWILNLIGLIPIFPGGANVTGNISVTFLLAFLTFLITNFNGNKHYWKHILWNTDVPLPIRPIISVIECISIFSKPFALMIRLFANILAGHTIILSIIGLTFILQSYLVGVAATLFATFMNLIELLVAALQAYVFTILSAMFIGEAVKETH